MNTDKLAERIKNRFDHNQARRVLREKYHAKMYFAYNGGMWYAGPTLLNTLHVCPDEDAVIEDTHGNPVKINVPDMIFLAEQRWQEQMHAWHDEYEQNRKKR